MYLADILFETVGLGQGCDTAEFCKDEMATWSVSEHASMWLLRLVVGPDEPKLRRGKGRCTV